MSKKFHANMGKTYYKVVERGFTKMCKNVLKDVLKQRDIPELLSREEMMEILFREEYGYMPPKA